ncbi:MAG TPA: hypothetical protein VNO30_46080 [Kofleriaceae bacterium]|nr:hypothetical protein [Kofleriaceae bacterium]
MRPGTDLDPGGDPRRAERIQRARQLRRALVATFDVNGDGRLGPRERMRAARVLRRIEGRLAAPGADARGPGARGPAAGGPDARGRAVRGAIRRFDRDGDGNVGPGEMPPAAARKLRRLDRDGDGWVEPGEYR